MKICRNCLTVGFQQHFRKLGELNRGKSKHRPRNAPHLYGGEYPFIQTGDVKSANGIIRKYHQTYSESGLKQSRLWKAGTLCITIAANNADTAILGFDSCFPDSVVGFQTQPNHSNIHLVELFIRAIKENLERYAPATAQKNINLEILESVFIPLPPLTEQQRIVEEVERLLSVADAVEATVKQSLKQAERLRQSILKRAFEGKLTPQDDADEPAQILLERIKREREEKAEKSKAKKIKANKTKTFTQNGTLF